MAPPTTASLPWWQRLVSGELWHHPDFLKLWAGQTLSLFGSQITFVALPLTAALTLDASALQMGLLSAAGMVPFLLIGLVAGAWVDRLRRRPLLVAADLGRAGVLLVIPAAAWMGALRIEILYAVAFLAGVLTVFFDVAYSAYLPTLVGRDHLIEGNSKLEVSRSAAQVAGPGLAGLLVQAVTAPLAILVDAGSFLASALCVAGVRAAEPRPPASRSHEGIWQAIREGLRVVGRSPVLRTFVGVSATWNLSGGVIFAVYVLYVTRELAAGPNLYGLIVASGNVGFLLGALLAGRAAGRLGSGPATAWAVVVGVLGWLVVPLAAGPLVVAVPLLVAGQLIGSLGLTIFNVTGTSLRQAMTPDHLQGRVAAVSRAIGWGVAPIGALLGGALGDLTDLRVTLLVGVALRLLVVPWVWRSPLPALRELPGLPSA